MNQSKKMQDFMILLVCYMVIPISGMGTDMYAPALVHMGQYFAVSNTWVRLTMTAFLIGFSVGQLPCGAFSDQIGRRMVLLFCLFLFCFASFMAATTSHISYLIFWRFIQGLACSGPSSAIKGILIDRFTGVYLKQRFSMLSVFWGLGPVVSPFVGGYIAEHLGWRAEFYVMGGVGVFYFLLTFFLLIETHAPREKIRLSDHLSHFSMMARHGLFLSYGLMAGLCYAFILCFHVIAPFLVQARLGYSPIDYGYIALLLGLAWLLGSFSNRFLVKCWPVRKIIPRVIVLILLVNVCMLLIVYMGHLSLLRLLLPTFFIIYLSGIIFPSCMEGSVSLFSKHAGSAGAMMGFVAFSTTAFCTFVASWLHAHSQVSLVWLNFSFTLIMLLLATVIARMPFISKS